MRILSLFEIGIKTNWAPVSAASGASFSPLLPAVTLADASRASADTSKRPRLAIVTAALIAAGYLLPSVAAVDGISAPAPAAADTLPIAEALKDSIAADKLVATAAPMASTTAALVSAIALAITAAVEIGSGGEKYVADL